MAHRTCVSIGLSIGLAKYPEHPALWAFSHLFAAMYPHLCRIDYGCNNYRMHSDATESSHRGAPAPRAAISRAGLFATPRTPVKARNRGPIHLFGRRC